MGEQLQPSKALQKSHSWVRVSTVLQEETRSMPRSPASGMLSHALPKHHLYRRPPAQWLSKTCLPLHRPRPPSPQRTLQWGLREERKWKDRRGRGRGLFPYLLWLSLLPPLRLRKDVRGGVGPELRQLGRQGSLCPSSLPPDAPSPEGTGAFVLADSASNPQADGPGQGNDQEALPIKCLESGNPGNVSFL